ncbi:MAG: DUF4407 domain-containing protein [Bacteroidetes bacterium]|nr:DUF4407 domain-containing protein [Bacteroidota bacterium]
MRKLDKTFANWLGLSPSIVDRCSSHFRARYRLVVYALIAIHGFTVSSMAYGWWFTTDVLFTILASIMLFTLLFTFDRATLSGPRHWTTTGARLMLTIVLPLINLAFFDLAFFDSDIRALHGIRVDTENAAAAKPLSKEIAALDITVDSLWAQDDAYLEKIENWRRVALGEGNGTGGSMQTGLGPIFEFTKEEAEAAIEQLEQQRKAAAQRREATVLRIQQLRSRREALLSRTRDFEETGIAYRLELLHELLFDSELMSIRVFSIAYLLFFFTIDMLSVLPVLYLPFKEYLDYATAEVNQQQLVEEFRASQLYQYQVAEIQVEIERKLANLQLQAQVEEAERAFANIKEELEEAFALISWLERKNSENEETLPSDFRKMRTTAITRALDRFEEELEHIVDHF